MANNLRIIDFGNLFGTMNSGTVRLSNITDADREMIIRMNHLESIDSDYKFTPQDKSLVFEAHRKALADYYGFDYRKMFMADQKDKKGTYFVLDRDYVEANPNGWTDIDQDILIIRQDVPGVVAGHPVADCPVVIMKDNKKGITAVAHCSAEMIDKKLPIMMADALQDYRKTRDEDISVYVSSGAGAGWTYEGVPAWLNDWNMWLTSHGIELEKENLMKNGVMTPKMRILLKNAIEAQLRERNISSDKIVCSTVDTITDPRFYSNSASSAYGLNKPEKFGRNFAGAFYQEEESKRSHR